MIPKQLLSKYRKIQKLNGLLPIQVSPFYAEKVRDEVKNLGHFNGPLTRIAFPNEEKMNLLVGNEFDDWVDDRDNMIEGLEGIAIQKYSDRLLLLTTDRCFSNCQYCFRQNILTHGDINKLTDEAIERVVEYIVDHPSISEVILSGGDPMMLDDASLEKVLDTLASIEQVKHLRIHTRSIIYSPDIFTRSRIDILAKYNVRLMFHITHPYEICPVVAEKIQELRKAGLRLYNQFPLLRGINDGVDLLIEHLSKLDELGVRNLSIFIPDPVKNSAAYRIPISRIRKIIQGVNWGSSSWVNSTRFLMDSKIGKIRLEDMCEYDSDKKVARFLRSGYQVDYFDFPEELDIPGDEKVLRWKSVLNSIS